MGIEFSALDANNPRTVDFGGKAWTGPTSVDVEGFEHFGFNNANGRALLELLGFGSEEGDLIGQVEIAEARRAIMRARNAFGRRAPAALERRNAADAGVPRAESVSIEREGNLIKINRGARLIPGRPLTEEGLEARLSAFERFVTAAERAGATHVAWS